MGVFQRLKQAVSTGLESLVDEIENREAVALATVQEMERGVARVMLQRKRVERRVARLEQAAADLESAMDLWRERALRDRRNRTMAVEHVRRLLESERHHAATLEEMTRARVLRDKVREDERVLGAKLEQLRDRCVALSSRESRISVREGIEGAEAVEEAFDRWEARIEEREAIAELEAHSAGINGRDGVSNEEAAEAERRLDEILHEELPS